MEPTAMTVVSQLVTDARTRYGAQAVVGLEVSADLLDGAMDHVLALGGTVGTEHCVVEGVEVRELPGGESVPRVYLAGDDDPRRLEALNEDE